MRISVILGEHKTEAGLYISVYHIRITSVCIPSLLDSFLLVIAGCRGGGGNVGLLVGISLFQFTSKLNSKSTFKVKFPKKLKVNQFMLLYKIVLAIQCI